MPRVKDDTAIANEDGNAPGAGGGGAGSQAKSPTALDAMLSGDSTRDPAWKGGGKAGCKTWGCLAGVAVLLVLMAVGYSSLEETVWLAYEKRAEKLQTRFGFEVPNGDRDRLVENLRRFDRHLRSLDEPFPVMGEFSDLAADAMADDLVSVREVRELNRWIEEAVDGGGTEGRPE